MQLSVHTFVAQSSGAGRDSHLIAKASQLVGSIGDNQVITKGNVHTLIAQSSGAGRGRQPRPSLALPPSALPQSHAHE